jgi:hypothetical protein
MADDSRPSPSLHVRKWFVSCEETTAVLGHDLDHAPRRAVSAAVVRNPFAGRFVSDLTPLVTAAPWLAGELARRCLGVLGVSAEDVSAYGKGAIVGLDGEAEHAAALIHPTFGAPVRAAIGGGAAIIPSTKVVASAGFRLTMPITNRHDIWVFDDMDAVSVSIDDAPRPDEIVVALAYATGGRAAHRITKAQ